MAKIHEEIVVIKLSKLVKDTVPGTEIATADIVAALQSVAEELAGAGVVVEAERAYHDYYNVDIIKRSSDWHTKR